MPETKQIDHGIHHLPFQNFKRRKVIAPFNEDTHTHYTTIQGDRDHTAGTEHNSSSAQDLRHPARQHLQTTYPILETEADQLWFIDASGHQILSQLGQFKERFHCVPLALHTLSETCMKRYQFWFMDCNSDLHVICGDHKKPNICHHLKCRHDHTTQESAETSFIGMDDIVDRYKCAFRCRKFFYCPRQQRLYMVLCEQKQAAEHRTRHRTKSLMLSLYYLDDVNSCEPQHRICISATRRWCQCFKRARIDIDHVAGIEQFDVFSKRYGFVLVYDTLLVLVVHGQLLFVDLTDFQIYRDSRMFLHPEQFHKNAYLLNACDDFLYFIHFNSPTWSKMYLPDIIPIKLRNKYQRRMNVALCGYVRNIHLLPGYKLFEIIPGELMALILLFTPLFLYF